MIKPPLYYKIYKLYKWRLETTLKNGMSLKIKQLKKNEKIKFNHCICNQFVCK
jgi:hypothetical protein